MTRFIHEDSFLPSASEEDGWGNREVGDEGEDVLVLPRQRGVKAVLHDLGVIQQREVESCLETNKTPLVSYFCKIFQKHFVLASTCKCPRVSGHLFITFVALTVSMGNEEGGFSKGLLSVKEISVSRVPLKLVDYVLYFFVFGLLLSKTGTFRSARTYPHI